MKKKPIKKVTKKISQKKTESSRPIIVQKPTMIMPIGETVLSLSNPQQIIDFGKVLKGYIEENNLAVDIQGKSYAMVDGWKFAGANFGLTAICGEPTAIHLPGQYITILYKEGEFSKKSGNQLVTYIKEYPFFAGFQDHKGIIDEMKEKNKISREVVRPYFAYKCKTSIVRISNQQEMATGFSICTNLEMKKAEFDEYSVHSMSQTRSTGKGFRSLMGYVMNSAGLEGTPAEEMPPEEPLVQGKKVQMPKGPVKQKISEAQMVKSLQRIQAGEDIIQQVKDTFVLNEEQLGALETMTKNSIKPQ